MNVMTYKKALELNETVEGLDLEELSLDDLLGIIEEVPGWDYPLAEELLQELANRASIDTDDYFRDSDKDCSDLWYDAATKLGREF